jgi:hypothetical protein
VNPLPAGTSTPASAIVITWAGEASLDRLRSAQGARAPMRLPLQTL